MDSSLFRRAVMRENDARPPVWFMRQAGRYHAHYQALRAKHGFVELCREPELACEVTMGPINDFDFDAAILFSDILFPLDVMGMGLSYDPAPALEWYLDDMAAVQRLDASEDKAIELGFQSAAVQKIRGVLPAEKGLLGFVGAPLTLFCYAVDGSHKGDLSKSINAIEDGRFEAFCQKLIPMLARNMADQALAGADSVAIFDTCAGDIPFEIYRDKVIPVLTELASGYAGFNPDTPLVYYSKGTGASHWDLLQPLPVSVLAVDWKTPMTDVLTQYGDRYAVQGNVDPGWLLLPASELDARLRIYFEEIQRMGPEARRGWICGLGHGVTPKVPEENVRLFLKIQKEMFA